LDRGVELPFGHIGAHSFFQKPDQDLGGDKNKDPDENFGAFEEDPVVGFVVKFCEVHGRSLKRFMGEVVKKAFMGWIC